jgi:ABC-type nickel/cobalt efflux system permease component RcnA
MAGCSSARSAPTARSGTGRWTAHGPDHGHSHGGSHDQGHTHEHGQSHDHGHSHGSISHDHLAPPDAPIGWRSLFVLGLAGGLISSPNALIILLAAINVDRPAYGLVLVIAFGLGMAVVLGGVGLALVFARDRLHRLPSGSGVGRLATYAHWVPPA